MDEKGRNNSEINGKKRKRVGLFYDERMCNHHPPYDDDDDDDHPECPDRIRVIFDKLTNSGLLNRCEILNAKEAEDKYIQLVHSKYHVDLIRTLSSKQFDSKRDEIASEFGSIYLNEGSSQAAYLAAGSVLEAAEKVAKGDLDSAFAIVRPPGHHAEHNEPMGFCLFNNAAIAASYLLNERPELDINKILIVDWDIHHGNATQKMFWKDSRILFFSVHRHDFGNFYPGTEDGSHVMIGEGPGEGYNINIPWEHGGYGDPDYVAVWDYVLTPVVKEYNPDIIIVSAGFDAAAGDPLGGCCVTPYGYAVLLRKLMDFAQGKLVLALEGGYNLQSLANSVHACVQVLLEEKSTSGSSEAYPFESTWRIIENVRKKLCKYWPSLCDELPRKITSRKAPQPQLLIDTRYDSEIENIDEPVKSTLVGLYSDFKDTHKDAACLHGELGSTQPGAVDWFEEDCDKIGLRLDLTAKLPNPSFEADRKMSMRDVAKSLSKATKKMVPVVKSYPGPKRPLAAIPEPSRVVARSPVDRSIPDRPCQVERGRSEKRRSSSPRGGAEKRRRSLGPGLPSPIDGLSQLPLNVNYDLDSSKFFKSMSSSTSGKGSSLTKGIYSPGPRPLVSCSSLEGRRVGPGTLSKARRAHEFFMEMIDWASEMELEAMRVGRLQNENAELRRARDAAVVEATKEKVDALVKEQVRENDKKWAPKLEKKKQSLLRELEAAKKKADETESARLLLAAQLAEAEKAFLEELQAKYMEGWSDGNAFTRETVGEFCPTFDWVGYAVLEVRRMEEARQDGGPSGCP